jgi:hypothetical protein
VFVKPRRESARYARWNKNGDLAALFGRCFGIPKRSFQKLATASFSFNRKYCEFQQVVYPTIYTVSTIQGGAGFLNHPQYFEGTCIASLLSTDDW